MKTHFLYPHEFAVTRDCRRRHKGHPSYAIWFTGLSGAGKSTIANLLECELHRLGRHTFLLDGDNVRSGLNQDLGFSDHDRSENLRRVGEVARLMVDAGLIVLAAFISPFHAERQKVRSLFGSDEFIEVFVDVPLSVAEARDPKCLYQRARRGEIRNFTGIDSPYEAPRDPDIRIGADRLAPDACVSAIIDALVARGLV